MSDDAAPLTPPPGPSAGGPVMDPAPAREPFTSLDYFPDPRIRWGLGSFWAGFGIFIGIIVLLNVSAIFAPEEASGPLLFGGTVLAYGGLVAVIVFASRRRGLGTLRDDYGLRFKPIDLLFGAGAFLGVKVAAVVIAGVLLPFLPGEPTTNVTVGDGVVWILLNTIIASTVVAPIVEELFFRGMLLRGIRHRILRGRRGSELTAAPSDSRRRAASLVAILASSLLFMALHLYQADGIATAVTLSLTTFLLGLANAWIATATGRLGGPIVAHVLNNGFAVFVVLALLAVGG